MTTSTSRHVLIVGGGIAGCMTAMRLIQRGCHVTVVERGQIASQQSGESSWAGAGILFPLLPWMYRDAVNQLTLAGAAMYPSICDSLQQETGIDVEYRPSGMLVLPPFDLARAQAWCRQHGLPASLQAAASHAYLPPHDEPALWLPQVGQVRPPRLLKALRAWLLAQGATLLEHTELLPLTQAGVLQSWQTTRGELLQADRFVVTSGAWSFELLRANASKLNIKPMRGQILLYQPGAANLPHMLYRDGFYMVPRQDGLLLAGSTLEDVGFDSSTTDSVRQELQAKAEAILPALRNTPILQHWSGLRPGTPDNLPTIAEHPAIQNLFLNTGHFRYGLTMAPCSADIVASLVCDEQPACDASPFAFPA